MAALTHLEAPGLAGLLNTAAMDSLQTVLRQGSTSESDAAAMLQIIRSSVNQLHALELKVISVAQRSHLGAADGLVDAGAWVARESRVGGAEAKRSVRLATSLEALPYAGGALVDGLISREHAEVIASATKKLPAELSAAERGRVETALTEQAKSVEPATLRKLSRRAVEIAGRSIVEADEHENQLVRTAEEVALLKTRLSLHDNNDGTVSGHFTVPTLAGGVLRKAVQQITAPRRAAARGALEDGRTWTRTADHAEDWPHQYGLALVELLEHLPTDHLHAKVAATVIVTMQADQLGAELNAEGVATVGLKVAGTDIGHDISASKARQLACNAGIMPAVLGGASVSLDFGRERRLFSDSQRTILATRYDSCAAAGCDRPYAWSELHHRHPWHRGGRTDLDLAIPLCWRHHRTIHDPGFANIITDKPDGTKQVHFRRRS